MKRQERGTAAPMNVVEGWATQLRAARIAHAVVAMGQVGGRPTYRTHCGQLSGWSGWTPASLDAARCTRCQCRSDEQADDPAA